MEKQIAKLRLYLFVLGFAFIVQLFFSVLYFRHSNFLHTSSLSSIDSLIGEVGELKSENQQIHEKFSRRLIEDDLNRQLLFRLNQNIVSDHDDMTPEKKLEKYADQLTTENISLKQSLQQKDRELSNLVRQKKLSTDLSDADKYIQTFLMLGHNEGLTDSIQLAFANPTSQKITLVGIPRDLYHEGRKINEFLQLYGPDKLKKVIAEITGFKIDYYVSINFQAFIDLIDLLGGLEITVDKKILDQRFPDGNGGYKTVTFEIGSETMDGARVLDYARSRKSTSDFDRSLRQQKILLAIRQKLITKPAFENITFYFEIYDSIKNSLKTNMDAFEALHYFEQYKKFSITAGNILSTENFLYSSVSSNGQSILLPNNGDYSDFQRKLLEII